METDPRLLQGEAGLKRGNPAGKTVRFSLTGTATAGEDYEHVDAALTFADTLNPAHNIFIKPLADAARERVETVTLTLSPGSEYALGTHGSARVRIPTGTESLAIQALGESPTYAANAVGRPGLVTRPGAGAPPARVRQTRSRAS